MIKLKSKLKKIILFICCFLFLYATIYTVCADDVDDEEDESQNVIQEIADNTVDEVSKIITGEPTVNSRKCVIYDRASKTIIYGKNENVKTAMASTTKIMTAIVVLENSDLKDQIEVSSKAGGTGGSRLGLKKRR